MKSDTAYEEEVLQMLEERFSAQLSVYEPNVEYQVIGASKEDCYGAAIPLKSYGWMSGLQNGLVSSAGFAFRYDAPNAAAFVRERFKPDRLPGHRPDDATPNPDRL